MGLPPRPTAQGSWLCLGLSWKFPSFSESSQPPSPPHHHHPPARSPPHSPTRSLEVPLSIEHLLCALGWVVGTDPEPQARSCSPSADPGGGLSSRENFWKPVDPRYGQCLVPFLAVLQGAHGVWQASPGHPLPSRAWRLWATPTPCPPPHHHHMDILWARHQVGCGLGSLERRSPGATGKYPSRPPGLQAPPPARPGPAQPSSGEYL